MGNFDVWIWFVVLVPLAALAWTKAAELRAK